MIAFARFASLLAVGFALAGPVSAADALPKLTQLLAESSDAQFQLDVLRGLSDALKGRRTAPMPVGWEAVEAKLADSANADVRTLTQTLSLTFGSPRARTALRATAANPQAEAGARRTALDSLLAIRDPNSPGFCKNWRPIPPSGPRRSAGSPPSTTPARRARSSPSISNWHPPNAGTRSTRSPPASPSPSRYSPRSPPTRCPRPT